MKTNSLFQRGIFRFFAYAGLAALLTATPALASAHLKETIGFEFEDYLHVWPANAPPHKIDLLYQPSDKYPAVRIDHDDRRGYKDLEVHAGPFSANEIPHGWAENYLSLYKTIIAAADKATEQTKEGWYKFKLVMDFSHEDASYQLAYVPRFLREGIPNKTEPQNPPFSDVGPQATFSLDAREVYYFFKAADTQKHFPFFYDKTMELVHGLNKYDEEQGSVKACREEPEKDQTLYGCSIAVRGFVYFLAEYLNDSILAANSKAKNGGGEIKKESYYLYLRNIKTEINAVKEYFDNIVATDPLFEEHKEQFEEEMSSILPKMLPKLDIGEEYNTTSFVKAYLEFLNGKKPTGFEYGPKDEYGFPKYEFLTLSDSSDVVIKNAQPHTIYMELRNLRNYYTTHEVHKKVENYAIPYSVAVDLAENVWKYLAEFHAEMEKILSDPPGRTVRHGRASRDGGMHGTHTPHSSLYQ